MTDADAAKCMKAINELRSDEGASVMVFCDNADWGGPACAIEVCDDWTDYKPLRIEGESVLAALTEALTRKKNHAVLEM